MPSISIVYRKDKINAKGLAPVHFRIIKNRKPRYISSGIMLEQKHWDFEKNKIRSTAQNSARLNSFITNKYAELQDKVFEYETHHKSLSSKQLKEKIYGKAPQDHAGIRSL